MSCHFLYYGQVLFHLTVSHSAVSHGRTQLHPRPCLWIIHLSQREEPTSISASIFPFFSEQQTFGHTVCIIQRSPVLTLIQLEPSLSSTPQPSHLPYRASVVFCRFQKEPLREAKMFCYLSTNLFCPYSSINLRLSLFRTYQINLLGIQTMIS